MMIDKGYGDAAARIQEPFLSGRKQEAIDAVPDEFVDEAALVGPEARIRTRFRDWKACGITGITVMSEQLKAVELMARVARLNSHDSV